jgi:hypothetical protein
MLFTINKADDRISTFIAQTLRALNTQNNTTQNPQITRATQASQIPLPTQTPYPTYTTFPIDTSKFGYSLVVTSTPKPSTTVTPQPCNQAFFISETIPDGTKLSAGTEFTKSWRLKYLGKCTWITNYKRVFFSGDLMNGPNSVKLDDYNAPGEKTDIQENLKVPAKPGTYTGYWKF